MPRRSAAALTMQPVHGVRRRLALPAETDPKTAAVVHELEASVSERHFAQSDARLLLQYADALVLGELAAKHLRAEGVVLNGKASPWLFVAEKAWKAASTLAGKLRLCPASRYDARAASRRADKPGPVDIRPRWRGSTMSDAIDDDEITEDEQRTASAAQCRALRLKPWQTPPCALNPDEPPRSPWDEPTHRLLRAMLRAGVSPWVHDPIAALADAKTRRPAR